MIFRQSHRPPTRRVLVIVSTAVLWLFATAGYAYLYVAAQMDLTDAVPSGGDWAWQLFFFAIVRLPLLILVLVGAICLEHMALSRSSSGGSTA
jgi:hypothetical protein